MTSRPKNVYAIALQGLMTHGVYVGERGGGNSHSCCVTFGFLPKPRKTGAGGPGGGTNPSAKPSHLTQPGGGGGGEGGGVNAARKSLK